MTLNELYDIKNELNIFKRNKKDLIIYYINKRLNKSLETYYKTLVNSVKYAEKQNELKLLRNLKGIKK